MELPDIIVKKAIQRIINETNKKVDLEYVVSNSGAVSDIDKRMVIKIIDMNGNIGLGIIGGKMVEIEKIDKPDSIFTMNKNTFSLILLNKIDHRKAFFMGAIQSDGSNWLRDSQVISKVFDKIKEAIWSTK